MKKIIIYLLVLISISAVAQKKNKIPSKTKKSVSLLAVYLTQDATTEQEKIDTIYSWVTNTIAYDYKKVTSDKPFSTENGKKVLKAKKAISTGYCELMNEMLTAIDIESEIVYGYVPSSLKDTIVLPSYDNHSWLAVKIKNKWSLTDPTWDAGYIGSIRTNKIEKYKKKWGKLNGKYDKKESKIENKKNTANKTSKKEKLKNKLENTQIKRYDAELALERSELKAKDFTGKTGFVRDAKQEWYMTNPDSFLVAHLPSNPMWQLKKDTISCSTFSYGKDSILSYVNKNTSGHYHFNENIEDYQNLDLLEQLIWNAEDAYKYNPNNVYTKAFNYYNYVNILTNKKVQKEVPDKYKISDFSVLLPIVDTASTYAKRSIKSEKTQYKFKKKYYKALSKKDISRHKQLRKSVGKGIKHNDKAIKKTTKTISRLRKQNHSLEKKVEKLRLEFSTTVNTTLESNAKYLGDSLNILVQNIELKKEEWKIATQSNYRKSLINGVLQNRYLVNLKNKYLAYNDYNLNKYIDEIDFVIDSNKTKISEIYLDSLPVEMLTKDIYDNLKALSSFVIYAEAELENMKAEERIKSVKINMDYFNQILAENYDSLIQVNQEAVQHNVLLKHTLNKLSPFWKDVSNGESEQKIIIEVRYKVAVDKTEHENERQKAMFDLISKSTARWKKEFKE